MKKIFACVLLALMVAIVPLTLVGCKTKIEGTWVFADFKIEYADGNEKATKDEIDLMKKAYKDVKFTFYKNGTCKLTAFGTIEEESNWKQIGNKIVVSNPDNEEETENYYLRKGRLYTETNILGNGNKLTIIFKKK